MFARFTARRKINGCVLASVLRLLRTCYNTCYVLYVQTTWYINSLHTAYITLAYRDCCTCLPALDLQFGKVHRGLWRQTEVAVKIILVSAVMAFGPLSWVYAYAYCPCLSTMTLLAVCVHFQSLPLGFVLQHCDYTHWIISILYLPCLQHLFHYTHLVKFNASVPAAFLCSLQLPANMSGSEKREKMVVWEAAISSSLMHPNIVQTYTYSIKPLKESVRNESLRESGYGSAVVIVK